MEKLKSTRGGHRSAVTRYINRTEEKIEGNDISRRDLCAAVDTLQKKANILQALDNEILDSTDPKDTEQEILDTDDFTNNLEMKIRTYRDMVKEFDNEQPSVSLTTDNVPQSNLSQTINSNQNRQYATLDQFETSVNQTNGPSTHQSNFYHRLPKLDLPSFSGNIIEWQQFWESFETTVHTNPSLTNVQKFSYLKSQVTQ